MNGKPKNAKPKNVQTLNMFRVSACFCQQEKLPVIIQIMELHVYHIRVGHQINLKCKCYNIDANDIRNHRGKKRKTLVLCIRRDYSKFETVNTDLRQILKLSGDIFTLGKSAEVCPIAHLH